MRSAQEKLTSRIPNLKVEYNQSLKVPEIVSVEGGGALAPAATGLMAGAPAPEFTLKNFLKENAGLYGLTSQQVEDLVKVSDYTNPAGNLSFVEYQQQVNGIPVFQGYVRGILTADGRLARTTGLLAAGVNAAETSTAPSLSAARAVTFAAGSIRVTVDDSSLAILAQSADGLTQKLSQGPFVEPVQVSLVYFPLAPGQLVLAYSMVLWQKDVSYYVLVDAQTGTLLWRKNITQDQTQSVTYNIYNNDSPTPLSPTNCTAPSPCVLPPGITRTDVTLINENAADNLGWIADGAGNAVTTGNNVDAGLDRDGTNGIDPTGRATATGRTFSFPYIPDGATDPAGSNSTADTNYRMGVVTNIFFWSNRYHDLIYNFGFTEPARNFQTDNFGRGGLGNDFVRAEAQDSSGTNNANFSTPADGSLPRMQMFIFTTSPVNRDGDLDAEVFYHELTHGTSNRLHGNATGLGSNESSGMGEGWSDFYARALRSDASENVDGLYAAGGYVTKNYYYGIRRFPYAVRSNVGPNGKPHNPTTFADTDPAQIDLSDGAFPPAFVGAADEVHNIGDVWCNILLEMRANLIHALGFATGNPRSVQIVTDGMKLDPVNPSMIDARNSILAANCAGFSGASELDIWRGFSVHGMGFRAGYALGPDGANHVVENFDGPNLTLGNVVATETTGNGNGQFDPGETVSLSLPLSNTLCATTATNATAAVSPGGGSANYGAIAPGGINTQAINFTIPTSTACGSAITFDITVNSTELGPIHYSFSLPIGQRAALSSYENFDGVTAPALPSGWTTTHSGAGLGWVTSATNPDTAPNAATTGDQANEGTDSLTSPPIPINTALGQLSFRNLYNLENGFDSMSLQIKIGNGSFQDIIAAGGSFVSAGYNNNIGWTGLSAGTTAAPAYVTTLVNLPASANGQFVQFRWTVHSDSGATAPGQAGARIDTIQLVTTAQACATVGASTITISGRVTDGAASGLSGIQLSLTGTTNVTTITDGSGNYSFASLISGGNYTVTPSTPGYDYTPANRVFNNQTANVTNADFTAIPSASISGRVTLPGGSAGVDGVTMTLSGTSSATTTTTGGGFYSFSPLTRFGNYIVTPSGGNNVYSPTSLTFNNLNTAITSANFTGTENVACNPVGAPITGSIAAGDTTQTNRLFRDGVPSTCAGKTFPGESAAAPIRYDQYTFTNTSGSAACIKVSIAGDFAVHSEAYLNSYDPANKGTNYLGDLGISYPGNNSVASYSINVPAGGTYVIVVNETSVGAGGNYTLSLCSSSVGSQTPTPAQKGQVLISEFRQSVGSTTSSNEYVELYNNTDGPLSLGGYGLALFNASFGGDVVLGFPAVVTIPRRGHLLVTNTAAGGYSLNAYAAGDLTHTNANLMPDNQGFGLIDASRSVLIDSVGFVGNSGTIAYIEGQGLTPTTGARPNVEHAWVRRINSVTKLPQDTDNNAADFQLVSVTGAAFNASPAPIQSILGAPGPENASSQIYPNNVNAFVLDPAAAATSGANLVRNTTPDPANNSTFGTLSVRRTVTNTTGASITRLRFRIFDITTLSGTPPAGTADLRARTSAPPATVTITGPNAACPGNNCTLAATTLEAPPAQALGGGLNSSLSAGTITLGTPLANGNSINLEFLFGVQQEGNFRLGFLIEGAPSGGNAFTVTGSTKTDVSGTKTVSGTFAPGGTVTYTVTLNNNSNVTQPDNPGDEFVDVLPGGLTLSGANANSGTAMATVGTNTVNWNGSIAAGGSVTITITATVNSGTVGTTISNQGTINYDADGSGTNESSRLTDDPSVPGTSDPTTFAVVKANQTITFGALADKAFGDPDFNVSATASSGLLATFTASGNCTVAGNTVHLTGAGSCTITAKQAGDANYNAAPDASRSFTIAKGNQTIAFGTLPNRTFGDADFSVTATASSGLVVSFVATGNCTIAGSTVHVTGAGSCTITAKQAGDTNYNAAPDVPKSFTIAKAATTTGVASSLNPSQLGESVTFTATVSGPAGTGTPTGTVQFKIDGTNSGGAVTLSAGGTAQLTPSTLTAGAHTVTADYNGDTNFAVSTGTLAGGQVVSNRALISFSQDSYAVSESTGFITLTINRTGDTSPAVNVDYATSDTGAPVDCATLNSGLASSRCDFTAMLGTLTFAANETQKTLNVPINLDGYTEGAEAFTVSLSNLTGGAAFTTPSTATVTINDSAAPAPNPIDDASTFVRQQYRDFLNRDADSSGLAFWVDNINKCNDPARRPAGQTVAQCIEVQRIITSAAFFLSIEFRQTGGTVRDFYVAALNRPATNNMPAFTEFDHDTEAIQRDVVVGQGNWQAQLDANRTVFMKDFVARPEFVGLYPTTDTPTQYVDKLYAHANVTAPSQERLDAIGEFGGAGTAADAGARGRALMRITQNSAFQAREINRSFVQIQYFGYLRRNPNDPPDNNFSGYDFWVTKLNSFNGDFLQAEMVKAFLSSGEYRRRFGP
jgi:hypothetical protein